MNQELFQVRSSIVLKTSRIFLVTALGCSIFAASCRSRGGDFAQVKENVATVLAPTSAMTKSDLGQLLFFDPRLSIDGTIACSSCHNVLLSGEDNRPNSVGVNGQHGGRTAPTVFNATYYGAMFWDGRAPSMEAQAKGPMTNPIEMGNANHDQMISRLAKIPGYMTTFAQVFGNETALNIDSAVDAIATYERTFAVTNSAYDRFMAGETGALSESAKRGMQAAEDVGCTSCHSGANFNGPQTPGQATFRKFPTVPDTGYATKYHLADDLGRYKADEPGRANAAFKNMWRVASWRNVALTAPYFHNGSVASLDEAVRVMAKTQLDVDLPASQVADIVEFLKSLTSNFPRQTLPQLPPTEGGTLFEN